MTLPLLFFVVSVTLLVTLLLGYPILVFLLSLAFPNKVKKKDVFPKVTVIIPCYNEGLVIGDKIANTFSMDYPSDLLEVIVVDSASNDGTWETLQWISSKYAVKLLRQPQRRGKASAINFALKEATGEIVFLTDADAVLKSDVIKKVTKNFADLKVGAVVARYKMTGRNIMSKLVGLLFSFFRERVRNYESILDSASYFTGELLAFRRSLIVEVDEDAVADDMFILMDVRRKGYRCVTETESIVAEYIPTGASDTLEHKRRTMYGILHISARFKDLLFKRKYGFFGCFIFPVSVARILLIPFACYFVEASFLYLLISINVLLFCGSILVFVIVLLALFVFKKQAIGAVFSVPILQTAMVLGIVDFLVGSQKHYAWSKLKKS